MYIVVIVTQFPEYVHPPLQEQGRKKRFKRRKLCAYKMADHVFLKLTSRMYVGGYCLYFLWLYFQGSTWDAINAGISYQSIWRSTQVSSWRIQVEITFLVIYCISGFYCMIQIHGLCMAFTVCSPLQCTYGNVRLIAINWVNAVLWVFFQIWSLSSIHCTDHATSCFLPDYKWVPLLHIPVHLKSPLHPLFPSVQEVLEHRVLEKKGQKPLHKLNQKVQALVYSPILRHWCWNL